MYRFVLAVILAVCGLAATASAEADLGPLHFLLGEWKTVGTPAGETGGCMFSLGVQGHVIIRTNYAVYEAQAGRAASRHEDLMVIYCRRK